MAKGISLHIGLNKVDPDHYRGWSGELNACEYDAEDMAGLAEGVGYEASLLKTTEATRDAVISSIRAVAETLKSGDIFLLTYSGHGGKVRDYNRDEPDNEDETWCLYDGQLIDDELFALWPGFKKGVRVFVLSDSCHSGTVIRLAPYEAESTTARVVRLVAEATAKESLRPRFMPREVAGRVYRAHKPFYDELQRDLPKNREIIKKIESTVRLISGCQDNQTSLDGDFNGLFTGTLLWVWDSGHFQGDYAEFHNAILSSMPPTQSPNHFIVGKHNPSYDQEKPFTI